MKTLLIFFAVLFSVMCMAHAQESTPKVIPWRPQMISFNDFKGPNTHADDKRVAAFTHTRLMVNIGDSLWGAEHDSLTIHIVANFYPYRSYFKPESSANRKLLVHEQLHFDIAEWHARLLRQQVLESKLTLDNYKKKLKKLTDNITTDLRYTQRTYDSETTHGLIEDEQRRWNDVVYQGLTKLGTVGDTTIVIKILK